jgi:hypothetical protein
MGADAVRRLLWPTDVGGRRYVLHERVVAIGTDFDVFDEQGHACSTSTARRCTDTRCGSRMRPDPGSGLTQPGALPGRC